MDTGPLRGVAHHVLPALRERRCRHEARWGPGSWDPPRKMGFHLWGRRGRIWRRPGVEHGACLWCLRPHQEKSRKGNPPRAYHRACKRMKDNFALGGLPITDLPKGFWQCAKCGCGQASAWPWEPIWKGSRFRKTSDDIAFEVDHRVPLSIAYAVAGLDGWVRAMLPGNLQWLCRQCHRAKTTEDLRTLAAIRKIDRMAQLRELDRQRRRQCADPNQITLAL